MKVEVEDVSPVVKRVQITIPSERVKDEFEQVYEDIRQNAQVKGFRKGKVPRQQVERLFKSHVMEQVIQKLLEETAATALERKQIKPVVEPQVDPGELDPEKDFEYTIRVEVEPEVELKNYKELEIETTRQEVSEQEVDQALERLRMQQALVQNPEEPRPSAKGDLVRFDMQATEDGKSLKEESRDNAVLEVGVESYVPGLSEKLIGLSVGDQTTIDAQYPEDFDIENLSGRSITYNLTMQEVRERIMPDLDDEFAKEQGEYQSLDELRQALYAEIEEQIENANRESLERTVMDKLVELNPLEIPPTQALYRARELSQAMTQQLKGAEATPEQAENLVEVFKEQAEKDVKAGYLMNEVAKIESIEALEEDIDEWIKKEASKMGINMEKLSDRFNDEKTRQAIRGRVMESKILDFLVSQAKIKYIEGQPEGVDPAQENSEKSE